LPETAGDAGESRPFQRLGVQTAYLLLPGKPICLDTVLVRSGDHGQRFLQLGQPPSLRDQLACRTPAHGDVGHRGHGLINGGARLADRVDVGQRFDRLYRVRLSEP
jgi:hypothetical protein